MLALAGAMTRPFAAELTRQQAGKIAQTLGYLLEQAHFRQAELDDTISATFLKNYLDSLDYNHLIFLQSDVDNLESKYGKQLDDITQKADVGPGFEIYDLYLKRLEQRAQLVDRLLKEPVDFTKDESFQPVRNKLPWPKDESESEELWRQRIKFELLSDKLIKTAPKKDKPEKPDPDHAKAQETKTTEPAAPYDPAEAVKRIAKRYQRLLKTMRELTTEEVLQTYLTSLGRAFDPHTDYMSPIEAENFEVNNIKLSLSGIGALLRWEDGYTKIQRLVPGGPAEQSKQLKTEDTIIAVGQGNDEAVDVVEMPLNKVVQLIRGKQGTEVRLTILPANSSAGSVKKEVRLVRGEIPLREQFAKARVIDHVDPEGHSQRLGVINLPQFYEHCSRDVDRLIGRLQKENVTGLVLDLRRNGGGILDEAIALTGLFITRGPVVQVRDSRKQSLVYRDRDARVAYDGPLIVLVGHLSASASEIVAAALQDYGRAIVIGDQSTHGKGTVQQVLNLAQFINSDLVLDPGKVKLTVSKFYRIAGGTTQKQGVTPDLILPSIYDYMELGEGSLPNALSADGTTPLEYTKLDRAAAYLEPLKSKSSTRVSKSTDFGYIREDIEIVKKQRADKTVSLSEPKRLQEREEIEKRAEARKQERAQRKVEHDKVFELTLDDVAKNNPLKAVNAAKAKEPTQLASTADGSPAEPAEDEEEENPTFDPQLEETLNILADYTHLLPADQGGHLAARANPTPARP
jgi:carboxyl-terminal processing protease